MGLFQLAGGKQENVLAERVEEGTVYIHATLSVSITIFLCLCLVLKIVHKYYFCLLSYLLKGQMDCIRHQRSLDNLGYLIPSIFLSSREDSRQKV